MNTNTVHYKGFDIAYIGNGKYAVITDKFSQPQDGYSTQNNAKGAITKHLNAVSDAADVQSAAEFYGTRDDAVADVLEALRDRHNTVSREVSAHKVADTCPTLKPITPEAIAGWTNQRNERGEPVHSDPRLAHIYAELDYFGMTKVRDSRSRNKREGKFTGRLDGGKKATRQGKRFISDIAKAAFPVPSWNASAWQNSKYVSRKVGA